MSVQSVDFNSFRRKFMADLMRGQQVRHNISDGTVMKLSLGEVLEKGLSGWGKHLTPMPCLYIVESEKETIYVGYTKWNATIRLWQHIQNPKSKLGRAIRENPRFKQEWSVKMIKISAPSSASQEEKNYIKKLKPIFNRRYNPDYKLEYITKLHKER